MRQKNKKFFKILPWSVVGLMVISLAVGIYTNLPKDPVKAAALSITINSVTLTLQTDSPVNGITNIGDTIRVDLDVSNTDGACNIGAGTTATVDLTKYGGGVAVALACITPNGGVNDIMRVDFPVANAAGSGIDVGAANIASQVNVVTADLDDTPGPSANSNSMASAVDTIAPTFATSGLTISTDNGVPAVAAVNGGIVAADAVNVNATVTVPDTDTITWNASPLGGGASATQANNTPVTVAPGGIDNAAYAFSVTATDDAGNAVTATTSAIDVTTISLDNIIPTFASNVASIPVDNGVPAVAAVNGGIVAADQIKVNAAATAADGDTITWDASSIGGSPTAANNVNVTVLAGSNDGPISLDTTITDDAGNVLTSSANVINIDNIIPIITVPGTINLTDLGGDGIASIGDTLTYAAGTETTGDSITWTVDLSAYDGLSATAVPGAYGILADDDNNVAFSANEAATDDAGNTQAGAPTAVVPNFANIDNVAPTLSSISIISDNSRDTTLAMAGDGVYLTFDASETLSSTPPPVVTFSSGGTPVANPIAVADDGSTCGDTAAGDNTWVACYTVDPTDTTGAVTFTINYTDLALNSGATETVVDDASSVSVDVTVPSIARITAKTQGGAFPSAHDSVLWYNYTGDTFEAYVEGNEPLDEVRVCVRSLKEVAAFTQTCSALDFNNAANYISSGTGLGATSYTFTGTTFAAIAGANPLVNMSGYSMNVEIIDAAGNAYISPLPTEAFVMVYNVEPSVLDPLIANIGTTLWSGISDFTNVTGLTFQAENPPATLLGSLVLTGSVDLTDPATVTALQAFSTNVHVRGGDAADGAVDISVNASALAAFNVAADLTIAVPGATSQPGMIVYNDAGTPCGVISNGAGSATVCGDNISAITWNAGPHTLTFSTDGFSGFGADTTAPTVVSLSPVDNATGVAIAANLVMTFNEDVMDLPLKTITIYKSDTTVFESINLPDPRVTFSGTTVTINPTANFQNSTSYYVQISANAIQDLVGNQYAGIANTTTWNFTTVAAGGGGGGGYNPPTDTTPPTNTSITINSGAADTASQSVTLTLGATEAAQMMISNSADFSGSGWETFATSKTWSLTSGIGIKTVYAKFKDTAGNMSTAISDTINMTVVGEPLIIPTVPGALVLQDPTPAPPLPPNVQIGTLVKRADTSAVYFIDQDNRRHAFPNEATYFSWYPDFSSVLTISADTLAAIPLGSSVTIRPGTYLIKIQTDPKVYAVEPYGVIRWVSSEQIANKLYGSGWNAKIVDVDVSFFVNYQVGANIDTAVHPTGSVISYGGETNTYYIENGAKRYLTASVFVGDKFQNKFAIRNVSTDLIYTTGVDYPLLPMETLMTLR
jgi:hypothetical protein